jgi:cob(I)alamin adenosyltransferase
MRIYTRGGDAGTTALFGGRRVAKTSLRVGAYGSVDEANALLGAARAALADDELDTLLQELQNTLFEVGADLATPEDTAARARLTPLDEADTLRLERTIDRLDGQLEPLRRFVLPGGHPAAAGLHVARTVVRRAERDAIALAETEPVNPHVLVFLNRLSDLLFVVARLVNARAGVSEAPWSHAARPRPSEGSDGDA